MVGLVASETTSVVWARGGRRISRRCRLVCGGGMEIGFFGYDAVGDDVGCAVPVPKGRRPVAAHATSAAQVKTSPSGSADPVR